MSFSHATLKYSNLLHLEVHDNLRNFAEEKYATSKSYSLKTKPFIEI